MLGTHKEAAQLCCVLRVCLELAKANNSSAFVTRDSEARRIET